MDLEQRLDTAIGRAIAANRIVGAVTIVARDGEVLYRKAQGWFDRDARRAMFPEAIFRLASITKPLVAATALAMIDRGLLGLDNNVHDHIPWFLPKLKDGREARITVRQLLNHTSGLSYQNFERVPGLTAGLQATDMSLEENFTLWAKAIPLEFEPGTGWVYGPNIDVLGAVIEALHGSSLDVALRHFVADPLDIKDTGFKVTDRSRLAIPYADGPPGLRPMADPELVINPDGKDLFSPGRIFNEKAFQSGGAGAVGTADDLLKFFEAIRNRGMPILKPETVAQAIQNQIGELPRDPRDAGQRFGYLGTVIVDPVAANRPQAAGTIRWGGIYGHDWFVDFTSGITAVLMTNTATEGCIGEYPKELGRAIYGV